MSTFAVQIIIIAHTFHLLAETIAYSNFIRDFYTTFFLSITRFFSLKVSTRVSRQFIVLFLIFIHSCAHTLTMTTKTEGIVATTHTQNSVLDKWNHVS